MKLRVMASLLGVLLLFWVIVCTSISALVPPTERIEYVPGKSIGEQNANKKTGRVISIGDERILSGTTRLVVQEEVFWMQQKALDEADRRTLFALWDNFDYVDGYGGDTIAVIKFTKDVGLSGAQVEVVKLYKGSPDGRPNIIGRRGWMSSNKL